MLIVWVEFGGFLCVFGPLHVNIRLSGNMVWPIVR